MGEQTKNMLIGVFIIAACFLIVSIILFLKPSVGNGEKTYYVRFANINKINVGTRVTFAGKPVGEVVAIDEIYDARKQPGDKVGGIYFYQLVLKVDSSVNIYNTDEISLQTSGLLGEKSVAIIPKVPPRGVTPKLLTDQPIYANSVDPIENAFTELSSLAHKIEDSFTYINKWLGQNGDNMAYAIKSFGKTMDQINITMTSINQQKVIDNINIAITNASQTIELIHSAIEEMQNSGTFASVGIAMENIKNASHSIAIVSQGLADGTGTLGRLLRGDDLYLRFTAIMSKADTLMNDINHYGILFHLNKAWQRTHTQRIDLLNALNTPASFKSYFETEVDQINTSMSRLSMLVDRAEQTPERDQILKSPSFLQDFAELLRKTEELSDNLRLYNQQLMEAQGP
jgi:phospholipid/cholesterol/gamma-HCH transport system substrate-binding protein